jgi:hypothetical protein
MKSFQQRYSDNKRKRTSSQAIKVIQI